MLAYLEGVLTEVLTRMNLASLEASSKKKNLQYRCCT